MINFCQENFRLGFSLQLCTGRRPSIAIPIGAEKSFDVKTFVYLRHWLKLL